MKNLILILMLFAQINFAQSSLSILFDDVSYDADAKIYFDAMTTQLSKVQKTRVNTFIEMLKDSLTITSLGEKFDIMYLFANETSEAGLLNLVKRSHDATLTNAPVFAQWEGFLGANTKFINTNYNPSTQKVRYDSLTASVGIYNRTDGEQSVCEMGAFGTTTSKRMNIILRYAGVGMAARLNDNSASNVNPMEDARGFFIATRTNSTKAFYKTGVGIYSGSVAPLGIPDVNIYVLCYNNNGTPDLYSARQISFVFMGAGLTATEARQLNNCVEWYMDDLGKGVIP